MIKFYLQYFKLLGQFALVFIVLGFVGLMIFLLAYGITYLLIHYIIISSFAIIFIIIPFFAALGTVWDSESYYYNENNFWEKRKRKRLEKRKRKLRG